jgi:membrane-associated protease RseP (regulator of RpoE activity)
MSARDPDFSSFPPPRPVPDELELPPPVAKAVEDEPRFNWRTNALLFALTVVSVFYVGQIWTADLGMTALERWASAWKFALPLLAILVTHELGHYVAARLHRVPASLPYFLPLPVLNPFGTLGAVIIMPKRIRSARALLDIGAAGPLAGLVMAIPIMLIGLALSSVGPRGAGGGTLYIQEGQSLLYFLLKTAVHGYIPADQDVHLHPTALAAWVGLLVTFLNLIPYGQLDGGHVAYALLGKRQNRLAKLVPLLPVTMALYNGWIHLLPIALRASRDGIGSTTPEAWFAASGVTIWITLLILLWLLGRSTGGGHPPVDDERLSRSRKGVALFTLGMFVLLFMPSPWVTHQQLGKVLDLVELAPSAR